MMKRYIKMPLKYALPLLFVCALIFASTAGCTSSTSPAATATVKATVVTTAMPKATTTAGFDPLLATLESKLKSQFAANKITTKQLPKSANSVYDELIITVSLPNGDNVTAVFRNYSSVAGATNYYAAMAKEDASTNGQANPTYFGQEAMKAALGHAPTVVKDTALLLEAGGAAPTPVDYEVIQYDTIVVTINHIWPNSGSFV
jgi:hypothetical protein